jgi:hypothetical protein
MAKKIPPLLKYNKSNLKRVVTAIIRNLDHDLLSRQYKAQNLINPMHGHCHNATGTLYKIFRSDNVHAFRGIDKTGTYHWWTVDKDGVIIDITESQYGKAELKRIYKSGVKMGILGRGIYGKRVDVLLERVCRDLNIN